MVAKSPYQIRIPIGATEKNTIEALTKILPKAYAYRHGGQKLTPEQARDLAIHIVKHANSCGESSYLKDISNKINLVKYTPKQCTDFKQKLDEIVVIRTIKTPGGRGLSPSRLVVGKAWKWIKHDLLGHPVSVNYSGATTAIGSRG